MFYMVIMKLQNFTPKQIAELAIKIRCNPDHLYKIARGYRPCGRQLAEKIEQAMDGLLRKEDLVWPKEETGVNPG